jgi:hypothetical protein
VYRPALGPTQSPVQWVPGVLSQGVKRGRGVTLTTHPIYCRGREWVGAILPLPASAAMVCSGTALLYFCAVYPVHRVFLELTILKFKRWNSLLYNILNIHVSSILGANIFIFSLTCSTYLDFKFWRQRVWRRQSSGAPCSVVQVDQRFRGSYYYHHHPDDGGSKHLWNVCQLIRHYTEQYPRRLWSSCSYHVLSYQVLHPLV